MKKIHFVYVIVFMLAVIGGIIVLPRKSFSPAKLTGNANQTSMNISSKEFQNGGAIPVKFTCQGENTSPELEIGGIPAGAKSLALIMDDPDIPDYVKQKYGIQVYDHWVAFNIPPDMKIIAEGKEPAGVLGMNSGEKTGYTGPCPPDREHRYFFKLYALDAMLNLPLGSSREDVEKAMAGHIIAEAQLMGTYVKK